MPTINWDLWNTVTPNLGFTLCRGEELTLTEKEITRMNFLLMEMAVRSQDVRYLANTAKHRFETSR